MTKKNLEPWSKRVWYVAALVALLSLISGKIVAILILNIISIVVVSITSISLKRKQSKVLIQPSTSPDPPINVPKQEHVTLHGVQYHVKSKIQNKSISQKIEEPGSYVFLIFTAITSVFLFGMIFGFARVAIPEVIGILVLIDAAIALLIVFGTLKFYRVEGRKCFLISSDSIKMKLPMKSLEVFKWADFDEISIVARGSSYKKEHNDVKIRFIGSSEFIKTRKFKFRFRSISNASELINLIETYATVKNVLVKIDKKDIN